MPAKTFLNFEAASPASMPISGVISALSFALDLVEGQPMGHSVRTCVLAMHLAAELGISESERADLYYAALMKDAGCSTNSARMFEILGTDDIQGKHDVCLTDWTRIGLDSIRYALSHIYPHAPLAERLKALLRAGRNRKRDAYAVMQIRCERGAEIARRIGLSDRAADAIHSLNELWRGQGLPRGQKGFEIPLLARVLCLAQIAEMYYSRNGRDAALQVARQRSGRWFDPAVVSAFLSLGQRASFWAELEEAPRAVVDLVPNSGTDRISTGPERIDNICLAFADVIDAKSPFTYRHSTGVAEAAVDIATALGFASWEIREMRRAALLHDIGKMGISNSILDKNGKLTDEEWQAVRQHPRMTYEILRRVPGFENLSLVAAAHHEKLDGSGYHLGLTAKQLTLPMRVLTVADIYDALAARRPYREALPREKVFSILWKDAPHALDAECVAALESCR